MLRKPNWINKKICALTIAVVLPLLPDATRAQASDAINLAAAKQAFAEAEKVSGKEGGRLWGMVLYGPMFFVDPQTRAVVANARDVQGLLRERDGLYVGTLPESILLADSPTEWAGRRWTMLRWPMPDLRIDREVKFAHEMFHRIQPALRLDAPDTPNLHLDSADGRLWLQLEWRALAAALAKNGSLQVQAIRDALAFREHRHRLYPNTAASEASLEIAEGIPEYTGIMAAVPDLDSARWRVISELTSPDPSITFVRSFAYLSGPAYGLLLDQRLTGWRARLAKSSDLGALLASTLKGSVTDAAAERRAGLYGALAIRSAESDRAEKANAVKDRYRALLLNGPVLILPSSKNLSFSFNPGTLISLGDAGTVYPTFHASDAWGTLDVKDGVLVPTDFSRSTIAAPETTAGQHLQGPSWTLDLAPGWHVIAGPKPGSFTVQQDMAGLRVPQEQR